MHKTGPLGQEQTERLGLRLTDRLSELNARLHEIEAALSAPHSKDAEDQAIERESDEVMEDLEVAGVQETRMIEAALARIAAGTYGICAKCGAAIAPERLESLPATPFCRGCAA